MKRILSLTLIATVIFSVVTFLQILRDHPGPANPPDNSAQYEKDANAVVAISQFNDQWERSFDLTGQYPERQDPAMHSAHLGGLLRISPRSPSYDQAQVLREKMSARQVKINQKMSQERQRKETADRIALRARVAAEHGGRKTFAENLEREYLKQGIDAVVTVEGPRNTTLIYSHPFINRPMVWKITNETKFLEQAWDMGFERVVLRNRFNWAERWTYEAPK